MPSLNSGIILLFLKRNFKSCSSYFVHVPKQHLLTGKPASGKTSLSRKIGYLLEKQGNFHVVTLDAGDLALSNIDEAIAEISDAKKSFIDSLLIIVDDIHRSFEPANEVLLYIVENDINSLFSSRPSYRNFVDVKKTNVLIDLERKGNSYITELLGEDIQDKLFERISKSFANTPSEDEVNELKKLSEGNLWVFGRLLNTYDETGTFCFTTLHNSIRSDLEKLEQKTGYSLISAICELSNYGRYEIPILKSYFSDKFTEQVITTLVNEYIIFQKDLYLYFYHSTIAGFYNDAISSETSKNNNQSILVNSFSNYLYKHNQESVTIFSRLGVYLNETEIVLADKGILNALACYMENEHTSLIDCADLITSICRQGSEKSSVSVTKILSSVAGKIIDKINIERSLLNICYFLNSIPWQPRANSKERIVEIGKKISAYVQDHNNDERCFYQVPISQAINQFSTEEGTVQMVGCSRYIDRLDAYYCGKSAMCTASKLNTEIIRKIDLNVLRKKINISDDIYRAAMIINLIYWVDKKTAVKLFKGVNTKNKLGSIEDKDKYNYISEVIKLFG